MKRRSVSHRQSARVHRPSSTRARRGRGKRGRVGRILLVLLLVVILAFSGAGLYLYDTPAGRSEADTTYLLIAPGASYQSLEKQIQSKLWLRFPTAFHYYAGWKGLTQEPLRSGRYAVPRGASIPELVEILQHGEQALLTITPGALRTEGEVIDFLTSHLWLKADSLRTLLHSPKGQARYAGRTETFRAEVLRQPLTIAWDASGEALLDSIHRGYLAFWLGTRSAQARALGLTPLEVTTLASIVESESAKPDEYKRIAGLYLNRLRQGIRLQSDPTVKFAHGDFSLRRIRAEHLAVSSPYNTYQVVGLPPAPIVLPRTSTIDSVLSAEQHDYIYMCAREDFSGYHSFAADYATHLSNARRYQQELNRRGIK